MKFENEALFSALVKKSGMNLYLGAGFSIYAYNSEGEALPLGNEINQQLINRFSLESAKNYSLSRTCQKIKRDNEDALHSFLREKYTVKDFDQRYYSIIHLPVKSIITTNIDNLLEKIYDESDSVSIIDSKIYGSLEQKNSVNLYKVHGSVTYPVSDNMSFTEKELVDLFVRERRLFDIVSYKLSTAPTIFWGTSLSDNNTIQMICNSEHYANSKTQKWIVVYPDSCNREYIEDFKDIGFNIIEADTMELIEYLEKMDFDGEIIPKSKLDYETLFPNNFISDRLKKISVRRPVVDFFAGAEPHISDVLSPNVARISYFNEIRTKIITEDIVLVTGIPGCGKSTLLLQLALADEISGIKLWFNSITKEEANRLRRFVDKENNNALVFIDNLYSNMDAFKILQESSNIKMIVAERALNFDYIKRSFSIDKRCIVDVSDLSQEDVQLVCKKMNRPVGDAWTLLGDKNVSLLEIVFHVANNTAIGERIKRYINDLRSFADEQLKINLLELFALVTYTSYCGVPCSMDMLFFYFNDDIDNFRDIFYALNKMTKIIVESDDFEEILDQDYLVMRSKLFAEKSIKYIDKITMSKVLNRFWDNENPHIIYRYDVLKRKAYDADIITEIFNLKEGCAFYDKMIKIDNTPFVKHQYAIFLLRKKQYDLAWSEIDQAYTESEKKVFTIANTHAVILFEKNYEAEAANEEEKRLLKETMKKSFNTLEYCITRDIRINYHVLVYSKNAIRYYNKFGEDGYAEQYIDSSIEQLKKVLMEDDYMYKNLRNKLIDNQKELEEIKKEIKTRLV